MDWQFTPFVSALGFATLVSLCVAAMGLWYRNRPGGLSLGLMMLAVATWCFFYILEANTVTLSLKVLWSQFAYVGTLTAAPLFLQLVLDVTQQGRRARRIVPWLIWPVPVISLILVFTNQLHGLVWRGFTFSSISRHILIYEHGPWFWVILGHSYAVLLATTTMLVITAIRERPTRAHSIYEQQILLALVAAAPPWILNGLYVLQPELLANRDWTPAGFALTGLVLLWNIEKLPGQIILLHDVTARKQAEATLQSMNATLEFRVAERTAELLAQKERSEAILRSINDGILMTDRDLYILYVNPTFTDLLGYDTDEVLGCPVAEILGGEVSVWLKRAQEQGHTRQQELQLPHKDGRLIDIAMTISPMKGPGGVTGGVCTLRDVTRLRNLEHARKSFIDNISHELRTPVTNLRLYAHLMSQGELPEQSRSYLKVMEEQTAWLQHLIEDVLELTSLDSGEAIGTWVAVSPATVLDYIATRYQPEAERAGLSLHAQAPETEVPDVRGDQVRLIQAISEIADNAIRFTPPGGEVVLRLATREDEHRRQWVTLSVADTGPGIPREEQPRIFDRFFRGALTETGHLPGTGLGLSIAEAIIRAHGGQITLATGPGGTTFTTWLPVTPVVATALPALSGSTSN
jgi:PAS domain S-box-containing protein